MQEMMNENLHTCSLSCIELSLWNALWNVKKKRQQRNKKQPGKNTHKKKRKKPKHPEYQ